MVRYRKRWALIAVLAVAAGWGAVPSHANVLTFEEFAHTAKVPDGYGGLNWQSGATVRVWNDPAPAYEGSKYASMGFYFGGPIITSPTPFDLHELYINSPNGRLDMKMYGHRNGVRVYDMRLYPNQHGHISPPSGTWSDIDKITFGHLGGASGFAVDNFTYTRNVVSDAAINHDFVHGASLSDLGYAITSATATGLVELATDPRNAGNGVMRFYDSAVGQVSVLATKTASLPQGGVLVEFDYRFLTDAKLNVLLDGTVVDTIPAPAAGRGASARERRFGHGDSNHPPPGRPSPDNRRT